MMTPDVIQKFLEYGVLGLVCLGLWYEKKRQAEEFRAREKLWNEREEAYLTRIDKYLETSIAIIERNTQANVSLRMALEDRDGYQKTPRTT